MRARLARLAKGVASAKILEIIVFKTSIALTCSVPGASQYVQVLDLGGIKALRAKLDVGNTPSRSLESQSRKYKTMECCQRWTVHGFPPMTSNADRAPRGFALSTFVFTRNTSSRRGPYSIMARDQLNG